MLNVSRKRKTVYVAFFVSIASMVSFDFLTEVTDGFIIALSVAVMEVFIYCYEDLSALYIAVLSGIFSPFFRLAMLALWSGKLEITVMRVLPDMIFFFTFGICYTFLYQYVTEKPKSLSNFPYVILFSDFLGNTLELIARGALSHHQFYDLEILTELLMIAIVRTILVIILIAAIENYTGLILRKEKGEEYQRLLEQATVISEEIRLMNKNTAEVESVVRKIYALYRVLDEAAYPREIVAQALEAAKNAHEIKGDYQNVITVLQTLYQEEIDPHEMKMSEIVRLVQANVQAMIRKRELRIDVLSKVRSDFMVPHAFAMMSILRNLLTNAAEAIAEQNDPAGRISVLVSGSGDHYVIEVSDTGPGIEPADLENIFLEGYSTKFNYVTGYIQRGLGLPVVREYVENDFGGTISVDSTVGSGTTFRVEIPAWALSKDEHTREKETL